MSIGQRKEAQLRKWNTTQDAKGRNVETIQQVINIWIEPTKKSGGRSLFNSQIGLTNVYEFRFRYANQTPIDITANWRLVYDRRFFAVQSIEKENENRFYYIVRAQSMGAR